MNAEQQLMVDLQTANTQSQVDAMRASFSALIELNEMVARLVAVKYLALRHSGLSVEEALILCKG